MPRRKSSRRRRRSRHNNSGASGVTNEQFEGSTTSSENGVPEPPKSSSTPFRRKRRTSGASIRSSRRPSKNISDESGNEVEPEVLEYANYESSSSKNKIQSSADSVQKVEEYLMSDYTKIADKHDIASSDTDCVKKERRRKSRKERKEKRRLLDSNRTEDDDAYDEDVRSPERDLSLPPTKKDREEVSRKSRRKKRTRSRRGSSAKTETQENELPITEILRKAQENTKTRHEEEPVPLTELTTDTIYVQGRNGFSAMKISGDRGSGFLRRRKSLSRAPTLYPIKVAILAQKVWNSMGLIHQGLLAGMALMHFLLIQTFFELSIDVLVNYSTISEFYTNIFSYLVTMCVVSAFDKFDVAQVDLEHLHEIYVEHSRSFLAIPLYIATFCLHQTSLLVDDRISLLRYEGNTTDYENFTSQNSTDIIVDEDLVTWQRVTLAKDGLAVFAWLFVALGPREDMLLTHLKSMQKYADTAHVCTNE